MSLVERKEKLKEEVVSAQDEKNSWKRKFRLASVPRA